MSQDPPNTHMSCMLVLKLPHQLPAEFVTSAIPSARQASRSASFLSCSSEQTLAKPPFDGLLRGSGPMAAWPS